MYLFRRLLFSSKRRIQNNIGSNEIESKFSRLTFLCREMLPNLISKSFVNGERERTTHLKEVSKNLQNMMLSCPEISFSPLTIISRANTSTGQISGLRRRLQVCIFCVKFSESRNLAKFVFEEMAIAAFLICMWKQEREETKSDKYQSFLVLF